MLAKFKNYIFENQLFTSEDKLILALSGGIDSVVLLHLLHQAGYQILTAHCNFNLRGEESDLDEELACKLTMDFQIPFFCRHFDTKNYAKTHHLSIQVAARRLRYNWFERLRKANDYQWIVTAHHADDNAETILYHLTKGTGVAGLHGILPKNKKIVRPLLFATKTEILTYAQRHQLTWREDASNASDKYNRNHLRLNVIPELRKINPNFEKTLLQSTEKVLAVERVFRNQLHTLEKKLVHQTSEAIFLNFRPLLHLQEPLIQLFYLLEKYQFSYLQAKTIFGLLEEEAGKKFESENYILVKDRDFLVITLQKQENTINYQIKAEQTCLNTDNHNFIFQKFPRKDNLKIPNSSEIAYLDAGKLIFPLTLRKWKAGDRFQPLGMKGMKKISDFLNEQKIPVNLKNNVWVLCSKAEIVWVVGFRLSEKVKITTKSTQIFRIEKQNIKI